MIQKITLFLAGACTAYILLSLNPSDHKHEEPHHDEHEHDVVLMDEEKAERHRILIKTSDSGSMKTTFLTRGKVILHPDKTAHILPKVSGIVKEVKKNLGDSVRAGDVVAVIESKDIADAKAHYLAALKREFLAANAFDREWQLYSKKISSEEEFLKAELTFEEAKIDLSLARQKLFAYGLIEKDIETLNNQDDATLRLYEVRSPIKGTVVTRAITHGEYLEDRTPIFEIADLSKVLVEIGVYPKDLEKVQEGNLAEVECLPLLQQGKIIFVSPLIDEDTITAKAYAELDNHKRSWKPGTFVKVKITTDEVHVPIRVAKESIQYIDEEPVVFVHTKEGFLKTAVQLGRRDDDHVEITEGLDAGVPYAASNAFLLKADLGKDSVEHDHD